MTEDEIEAKEANRRLLDGAETKVRLDTEAVLVKLDNTMRRITDILFMVILGSQTEEGSSGRDFLKEEMVTRVSEIGTEERSLVQSVEDLAKAILGLARSVYEESSPLQSGTEYYADSGRQSRGPYQGECS
ncbi:MAG: hypothetical protein HXS52_12400 [Theionarchaea archaeon]|nr:hypothetical protein [Theionarchaea archaeon]MBU7038724.1 hypothetical protein [Theionarchaea archaeon]